MKTLSHIMMFLALGTMVSLSGISSCKKPAPMDPSFRQRFFSPDPPMDPSPNFYVSGAPDHAPIPGTLLLLGSGIAGMAFLGWKKRSKR